jgi:hypothetical protein
MNTASITLIAVPFTAIDLKSLLIGVVGSVIAAYLVYLIAVISGAGWSTLGAIGFASSLSVSFSGAISSSSSAPGSSSGAGGGGGGSGGGGGGGGGGGW